MAKISIVIPVYNVIRYLDECMESVCNQSLSDIEIICVDDGSTDGSGEVLDEYALGDRRIKVIHQSNAGYGKAMNVGMQECSGEYIGIVEPDDYIALDMFEKMYSVARSTEAYIIKANAKGMVENEGIRTYTDLLAFEDKSLYGKALDVTKTHQIFKSYIPNWSAIYKRDFIFSNNIRHNETPGASYQDQGFWFEVISTTNSIFYIDDAYYYYRLDNPESSMNNSAKVFCICDEYEFIYNNLKARGLYDKMSSFYLYSKLYAYLNTFNRIANEYKEAFINRFSEELKEHQRQDDLNYELCNDNEINLIVKIMQDPVGYLRYSLYLGEYIHEKFSEYHNIVIYGAGMVATALYKELPPQDKEKVVGFAVSDTCRNRKELFGVSVRAIDEYVNDTNIVVIIAVTERYQAEVYDNIKGKYTNIWMITGTEVLKMKP